VTEEEQETYAEEQQARLIKANEFYDALVEAGVVSAGPRIANIVIQVPADDVPRMVIVYYLDENLLKICELLKPMRVVEVREL